MSAAPSVPFTFNADVAVSPLVTLFGGFPRFDLEIFLQALAENQYLRILAEPNLTALSGEEASFLAGGEFPIPVVQGGLGGGTTSITIEYKEFGVRLAFRPVVLGDGGIRLRVATEMSELSDIGAVEIQGFRVPAVITRRAETTLEMNSGQTFGMAGLIQQGVQANSSRLPWLGDLPVLGALFRSVRYEHGETELLVLVTAALVDPLSVAASDIPTPGALHCLPNDWELYAEGRIEGRAPSKVSPSHSAWLRELGLDQLRGPGAWATYSSPSAESFSTVRPSPVPPPGDTETNSTEPGPAEEAKVPT
jgi:Flp pilus assembly secretin CpaC